MDLPMRCAFFPVAFLAALLASCSRPQQPPDVRPLAQAESGPGGNTSGGVRVSVSDAAFATDLDSGDASGDAPSSSWRRAVVAMRPPTSRTNEAEVSPPGTTKANKKKARGVGTTAIAAPRDQTPLSPNGPPTILGAGS